MWSRAMLTLVDLLVDLLNFALPLRVIFSFSAVYSLRKKTNNIYLNVVKVCLFCLLFFVWKFKIELIWAIRESKKKQQKQETSRIR